MIRQLLTVLGACVALSAYAPPTGESAARTIRVFVFAGQSNMVGADSDVAEIERFPPYVGVDEPRKDVRFHYCLGRETKRQSDRWTELQPIGSFVGPELSFARAVTEHIDDPVAIIKVAAGGTTLGADWNPDEPSGFELYPLALERVRAALADLERRGKSYRVEGFMWHQGENDMFNQEFKEAYGANLARFIESWRRDLDAPELPFYIGGHCTKTIWGMDNRRNMHAIERGQRAVTEADPLAIYVSTAHVGVKIGNRTGLHYHYGTLGQLQHGDAYAEAYLRHIGEASERERPLARWPYSEGRPVTLFVMAGHRNMEGERAFLADLGGRSKRLAKEDPSIAFRYDIGGGVRASDDWEPLGPVGFSDTFGPELSFAAKLKRSFKGDFAIAKFTHSGNQVIDWTPEGSEATTRNLYEPFVAFVRSAVADLEARGHEVELGGIVYHLGENDTAWGHCRRQAATWLGQVIAASRKDLDAPELVWFVSQQEPMDHEGVEKIDVLADVRALAASDDGIVHVEAFELPGRDQAIVLRTEGVLALGERLAEEVLAGR